MIVEPLQGTPDVKLLIPEPHSDIRGYFAELFRADLLAASGATGTFVQENESSSKRRGTVRGLHYQIQPFAQAKVVRVLAGSILDVVVDLRRSSRTFGRSVTISLGATSRKQLYVPIGFAHGFCTLEDNVLVSYKVSQYYNREAERAILWKDPALQIMWPVTEIEAILSDKDRAAPLLSDATDLFV